MSEIDPKATLAELRLAQIDREALERARLSGRMDCLVEATIASALAAPAGADVPREPLTVKPTSGTSWTAGVGAVAVGAFVVLGWGITRDETPETPVPPAASMAVAPALVVAENVDSASAPTASSPGVPDELAGRGGCEAVSDDVCDGALTHPRGGDSRACAESGGRGGGSRRRRAPLRACERRAPQRRLRGCREARSTPRREPARHPRGDDVAGHPRSDGAGARRCSGRALILRCLPGGSAARRARGAGVDWASTGPPGARSA